MPVHQHTVKESLLLKTPHTCHPPQQHKTKIPVFILHSMKIEICGYHTTTSMRDLIHMRIVQIQDFIDSIVCCVWMKNYISSSNKIEFYETRKIPWRRRGNLMDEHSHSFRRVYYSHVIIQKLCLSIKLKLLFYFFIYFFPFRSCYTHTSKNAIVVLSNSCQYTWIINFIHFDKNKK